MCSEFLCCVCCLISLSSWLLICGLVQVLFYINIFYLLFTNVALYKSHYIDPYTRWPLLKIFSSHKSINMALPGVLLWANPVIHVKIPFLYFCKYDTLNSVPSLTPPNSYISYTPFVNIKMSRALMQLLFLQDIHTVCTYLLFWRWIVVRTHPKIRGVFVAVVIQPFTHVVSKVKTPVVIWAELKVDDNKFRL
jgi:hypothetical protein